MKVSGKFGVKIELINGNLVFLNYGIKLIKFLSDLC